MIGIRKQPRTCGSSVNSQPGDGRLPSARGATRSRSIHSPWTLAALLSAALATAASPAGAGQGLALARQARAAARQGFARTMQAHAGAPTGTAITTQSRAGVRPGVHLRLDAPRQSATIPHLDYSGGPIISQVEVHPVFWGSNVNPTITANIEGFYTAITGSALFNWLTEYNTNILSVNGTQGTNQTLQHGSAVTPVTIPLNNHSMSLSDTDIETELAQQIQANHLPAPTANTLFAIYFPPGVQITLSDGSASCAVFCAYHSTMASSPQHLYYSVIPDFGAGSGCDQGCGTDPLMFNNVTAVSSHELIEAVTDPEIGLAVEIAPPVGWYDLNNGEIGDICNGIQGTLAGYVIQKEWSNHNGRCQVTAPQSSSPPGNDACGSATTIAALPFSVAALNTTGATTDPSDPIHSCTGSQDTNSVWYQLTPSQSGTVGFDPSGTDYFTTVTVYTGSCGSLTEVACLSGDPGTVDLAQGTTYLVEVSQAGGTGGGSLTLNVDFSHDAVMKSLMPKTIIIPLHKTLQKSTVLLTVSNADTSGPPIPVTASVDFDGCAIVTANPSFGKKAASPTTPSTTMLAPGASATAMVPVEADSGLYTSPTAKSPDRCYIGFSASSSSVDPQPDNNSTVLEVNVVDKNP